jgi:hypothetical protein
LALAHFRAGDDVLVVYERKDKSLKAKVTLKDWAELPGHEWRSRTDCAEPELPSKNTIDLSLNEDPTFVPNVQPLVLEDAILYPNPTDGQFSFSFTTEPRPFTVSITDVTGKVVYKEENDNDTGSYKQDINLKDMPTGNYVISVKQGDKIFTQQISKQ